jgi:RimJ/RimL family protein N-acetyltransferase
MITPRLRLHSIDLPGYAALRAGREEFSRYIGARLDPDWPTFGKQLGYFEEAIRADPTLAGWATWVAIHLDEGVLIGEGGYTGGPDADGAVEIGYAIVPSRRGAGYATEFARALVDRAFADPRVTTVRATTLAEGGDSAASQGVLRNLGFTRGAEAEEEGMRVVSWEVRRLTHGGTTPSGPSSHPAI